jgi:hypothetical protein
VEVGLKVLIAFVVQANWEAYMAEANADIPGHLMCYPVELQTGGGVSIKALCKDVPDFPGAEMLGGDTKLPNVLTT